MKNAIDLYSGVGDWTLGMKLSGINNLALFEWWHEANETHNLNFGTNHKVVYIRNLNVETDLNFVEKLILLSVVRHAHNFQWQIQEEMEIFKMD